MEKKGQYLRVNTQALAIAATITMGIAYVVCAVFTLLMPNLAVQLLGWVFHLVNLDKFTGGVAMTFGGVLIGLVQILIYTYFFVLLIGWLYNTISK